MAIPNLVHIFNLSFSTGIYPETLKLSKVIPIFKKGHHTLPENYRPISLLSCINKLLEKLIEKRLRDFIDKNNSFYEFQFGFRKNLSTCHALLEITNNIYEHLNVGQNVLGLYLDLKKAFDTVDHTILLKKLHYYGIRGLSHDLLASYLSNRKQCIYVNQVYSNILNISTGVPQGSVLGPLLFLIYVNDIKNAAPDISIRLFADDTNVFVHAKDCKTLIQHAKRALENLKVWFDVNKLTLHLGKTNFTIFHYSRQTCCDCPTFFMIEGNKICKTSTIKYLGLTIDDKLTWQAHVHELCSKLVKYTGIFFRIRNHLSYKTAVQMYYTFVYSRISYGIEVYGMANASTIKPLQIMQNRILKILTFKPRRYSTNGLFSSLSLLKISDIHYLRFCTLLYKYVNNMLSSVFNNIFNPLSAHSTGMHTRNNKYFTTTKQNNKFGHLTLSNYGCKLWQMIPLSIRSSSSPNVFKKNFKKKLLQEYLH